MATDPNQTKKDIQAFIVGGLFILALLFATYNYFNRNNNTGIDNNQNETNGETISSNTERGEEQETEGEQTEETETVMEEAQPSQEPAEATEWSATNYEQGQISTGEYSVKSGDTLWEIAEAAYGSGAEWTKILEANAANIGYLPSGQQALIYAGQTLIIP